MENKTTPAPSINLEELNPINDLLTTVLKSIDQWKEKNSEEALTQRVHKLLDANAETIVLKLLGFDNRWNKWELDHCNGRKGESAAGDYLRQVQQDAIQDWLKSVQLPELSKTLSSAMKKELERDYKQYLSQFLYEYARKEADKTAKEIIESLFSQSKVDGMFKLKQLIEGNKD